MQSRRDGQKIGRGFSPCWFAITSGVPKGRQNGYSLS